MLGQSELEIPEEQLRQALVENRGKHFPMHLRKAAVAYWNKAREQGISRYRISQALGMNLTTLMRWAGNASGSSGTVRSHAFRKGNRRKIQTMTRGVLHPLARR